MHLFCYRLDFFLMLAGKHGKEQFIAVTDLNIQLPFVRSHTPLGQSSFALRAELKAIGVLVVKVPAASGHFPSELGTSGQKERFVRF